MIICIWWSQICTALESHVTDDQGLRKGRGFRLCNKHAYEHGKSINQKKCEHAWWVLSYTTKKWQDVKCRLSNKYDSYILDTCRVQLEALNQWSPDKSVKFRQFKQFKPIRLSGNRLIRLLREVEVLHKPVEHVTSILSHTEGSGFWQNAMSKLT